MAETIVKKDLPHLNDFLLFLTVNNYSPRTISNYQKDLEIFNNFLNTHQLTLEKFTKKQVDQFKSYLVSHERATATLLYSTKIPLSPSSINRCLSALRSYLRFLIDSDIKVSITPDQLKLTKKSKNLPKVAEMDEFTMLIEAPTRLEENPEISSRNRAIFEVLFSTGLRISELTSLNRVDINNSGRLLVTGKGNKQRFAYLTPRAQHYLDQYLNIRSDPYNALFIPSKGKSFNDSNKRITPRYIENKLKKYKEILKINIPTTPHSFRHGFATYMAQEGASPVAIQRLLGHESLNTTTRYVNPSDQFAADSHRKFHPLSETDSD